MSTKPRVALLGGTGFAGRNVAQEFEAAGVEHESFSRVSGCDLRDLPECWARLSAYGPTHLVNCAAHVGSVNYVADFAADVFDDNMRMLLNLYAVARRLREAIVVNPIANCAFPGTMDLYEESELWSGPVHPSVLSYGGARRMTDALARCARAQYGVRSSNVFVPNMYGPHDSVSPNKTHALNALAIKFVKAKKSGAQEIEVWGTGKPIREWLYVKDFARVVRRLVESGEAPDEPVNIGQNHGLSVNELVAIIAKAVGFEGRIVHNLKYPDGAPKKVMSDKLFRQRFPDFRFTPFEEGLRETIEHYQKIL